MEQNNRVQIPNSSSYKRAGVMTMRFVPVSVIIVCGVHDKLRSDQMDYMSQPAGGRNGRNWLIIIKIKAI